MDQVQFCLFMIPKNQILANNRRFNRSLFPSSEKKEKLSDVKKKSDIISDYF